MTPEEITAARAKIRKAIAAKGKIVGHPLTPQGRLDAIDRMVIDEILATPDEEILAETDPSELKECRHMLAALRK